MRFDYIFFKVRAGPGLYSVEDIMRVRTKSCHQSKGMLLPKQSSLVVCVKCFQRKEYFYSLLLILISSKFSLMYLCSISNRELKYCDVNSSEYRM